MNVVRSMASEASSLRATASTLGLSDRVLSTAAAYAGSPSSAAADDALAACILLAAKTCEEPRRVRDVLNSSQIIESGSFVRSSQEYWSRKERLVLAEQQLLRSLGYETASADPQVLLLNALHFFRAPRALYELCVALLNDSAGACAHVPPRITVAAALTLGAAALMLPLPNTWASVLEVDGDTEAIARASHAILDMYDPPRQRSEGTESSTREPTPATASAPT